MPNLKTYADQISDAIARLAWLRTLRCPAPGCTLRIRYRAVTPAEARHLAALATDHSRHGAKQVATPRAAPSPRQSRGAALACQHLLQNWRHPA
ncbi:hypothetical protein [Streptomyces sp. NPDC002403]